MKHLPYAILLVVCLVVGYYLLPLFSVPEEYRGEAEEAGFDNSLVVPAGDEGSPVMAGDYSAEPYGSGISK